MFDTYSSSFYGLWFQGEESSEVHSNVCSESTLAQDKLSQSLKKTRAKKKPQTSQFPQSSGILPWVWVLHHTTPPGAADLAPRGLKGVTNPAVLQPG